MNARSISRFLEGSVLNTKNTTPRVSMVFSAAPRLGFGAVGGSGEVGPFAAFKRGTLLRSGFLGRNRSEASSTNLFSRFRGADVLTVLNQLIGVFGQMFVAGKAFKVFHSVVGFVSVNVVNVLFGVKRFHPARRDHSVHESLATQTQIAHVVFGGGVRKMISENFSAARNCVKVVEESVFDSVYGYADHAVPHGG